MGKFVILELDGDLASGLRVSLDIGDDGGHPASFLRLKGILPPSPELRQALQTHWIENYRNFSAPYRIKPRRIARRTSLEMCRASERELRDRLNTWLDSPDFRPLDKRLRQALSPQDDIRLLVRTSNLELQKLPWSDWELLDSYPRAEPGLAPLEAKAGLLERPLPSQVKVRILAILGHDEGIDVERDRHCLESLPAAAPKFLVKPKRREVIEQLHAQPWDIIFFAGHSETEGDTGRIHLNPDESLSLDELWFSLRKAVERGLQLAIFNSCDGLGLAQRLDELAIPQMIVMRELVPDRVAQSFLVSFLQNFAAGLPLYTAVREARQRLHDEWDGELPSTRWLPVICQGAGLMPPTWEELHAPAATVPAPRIAEPTLAASPQHPRWRAAILAAAIATGFVTSTRLLGLWQSAELYALDRLAALRPAEKMDDRFFLITIGEADLQYQDQLGMERRDALSPKALALLWQKLAPHQPKIIGFSVLDFNYAPQDNLALLESPQTIASCQQASPDDNITAVPGPDPLPSQRLGFVNVVLDPDGVVRRHLLGLNSGAETTCMTTHAFSLRVAEAYLEQTAQRLSSTELRLGQATLQKLSPRAGGYALNPSAALGFQIPLLYRQSSPPTASLADVISGAKDPQLPQLASNKIVLIGRDRHAADARPLPRWQGYEAAPGIELHAQMAGQLIDAARGQRPLLHYVSEAWEILWIGIWSLLGSAAVSILQPRWRLAGCLALAIALPASCYIAMYYAIWLPLVPAIAASLLAGCLAITSSLPRSSSTPDTHVIQHQLH